MKSKQFTFTVFLIISFCNLFSQDWVEFKDLREKEEGYVIESSGYTTKGIVQIKPCNEKTIIETKDSIIKIDPLLIKEIHKGTHIYIPKLFNDSTDFYFCEVIDTIHKLKFYKGYYCGNSHSFRVNPLLSFMSTPYGFSNIFWHSYVLTIDDQDAVSLDNTGDGINMVNYKKQLKKIFENNKKILQHLDTYKRVKFEDIPKVVAYINSLY